MRAQRTRRRIFDRQGIDDVGRGGCGHARTDIDRSKKGRPKRFGRLHCQLDRASAASRSPLPVG